MIESDPDLRLRGLLIVIICLMVTGGAVDLLLDAPERWLSAHTIFESAIVLGGVVAVSILWRGWRGAERNLSEARSHLHLRSAERDAWRASAEAALAGLGKAIDAQFSAWGLTPAERDVALQLLKGESHKAIAYASGRSERTIRQHAATVYQKSALAGRAELAAFFLADLMLPASGPKATGDPR